MKVNLPKSTKRVHYQIFKGITLFDIGILGVFAILTSAVGFLIPMANIFKIFLTIALLMTGTISIQKLKNDVRTYEVGYRFLKFIILGFRKSAIFIKPKFEITNNTNVFSFKQGKEKLYVGGVKLEASNLTLLNEQQQNTLIADFGELIRTINLPCKIIKTNTTYDFNVTVNNLQQDKMSNKEAIKKGLIDLQIEQLETIKETKVLTNPAVYIMWSDKNQEKIIAQTQSVLTIIATRNLLVEPLTTSVIDQVWTQLTFNNANLKPLANKFKSTDNQGFIWAINNLPKQINYFWLNNLFGINNVNVCINLKPINKAQAKKQLDNALSKIRTNASYYAQSDSQKSEAFQYQEAFSNQQQAVIDDVDTLKDISIFIIACGDKKSLVTCKRELRDLSSLTGWKYDSLMFLQQQGLLASYFWFNLISKATEIEMTCDTFATSFPIPDLPLKDEQGFLLAETISGKPVVWDLFKKNNERVNKNMLILGESGSGKSFTTKKILSNLAYKNARIFILDPEREYKTLTHNLDGQWIDVSGSNKNIINPLEIYKTDDDTDNADDFNNQLSLLESFFTLLFPKLTDDDQSLTLLIELVKETYFNFKITPNTNFEQLDSTSYPTFSDLYNLIVQKLEVNNNKELYMRLEGLKSKLTSLTTGTYSKYWNGHTKCKWKGASLVCFDLRELLANSNQKIINVQMLLILRLLGQEISANQSYNETTQIKQKLIIAVDEAHLLINDNNPLALDFLFHTMKRIRKCFGSLMVITQNITDFTGNENVRKKFTGIINNCQYWLVGGMQPDDLNQLNNMYKQSGGLSNAVKTYIANAKQGKFWFKISKQEQLPIKVLQLPIEVELVGKTE